MEQGLEPTTETFFGKIPYSEEKTLAKEIIDDVEEVFIRVYIPFIVIDKELVVSKLRNIKNKLDQMGI
jgi:hypothetical protein